VGAFHRNRWSVGSAWVRGKSDRSARKLVRDLFTDSDDEVVVALLSRLRNKGNQPKRAGGEKKPETEGTVFECSPCLCRERIRPYGSRNKSTTVRLSLDEKGVKVSMEEVFRGPMEGRTAKGKGIALN